ncbi:hypothetical protein [Mycobacterium stomatepiae]|uniref:hypothetical protein n=1 Tax=Mycobacterium stomatepiae TaxID=470076 RepID=UPI0021F31FBE|nr:hypothetical protein [Mycobacterium stomatepiae]
MASPVARTRWVQLGLGLVCMMAISSPQYVWTLMTKPLAAKLGIGLPELQVTLPSFAETVWVSLGAAAAGRCTKGER